MLACFQLEDTAHNKIIFQFGKCYLVLISHFLSLMYDYLFICLFIRKDLLEKLPCQGLCVVLQYITPNLFT